MRADRLGWLVFGFFGYLRFMVGPGAPNSSSTSSLARGHGLRDSGTSADLLMGMGAWASCVPGAPGGDSGLAVDLEPVQRPMGPAVSGDRGVAPRSLRRCARSPWSWRPG